MNELLNNLKSFDVSAIIADILKDKRLGYIIITIIQERLESKGETSTNQKLRTDSGKSQKLSGKYGYYSRLTETIKRAKGQPIDRVTLKDTGEFYQSFRSQVQSNELRLNANFRNIYENFQDSFRNEKQFQEAILDLTDDELQRIFDNYIYPQIEQRTLKHIGIL